MPVLKKFEEDFEQQEVHGVLICIITDEKAICVSVANSSSFFSISSQCSAILK